MALTIAMVTLDSTDPKPLAEWWAKQTGAEVIMDMDGWFQVVAGADLPVRLGFQKVDEVSPGKNKLHLDLASDDPDAEVERFVAAGATLLGERGQDAFTWTTLADPQGNEFCISAADH